MKLTELDPRWYAGRTGERQGITFDCPCCQGKVRLAVAIHLDGTNMDPDPDNPQQFGATEHVWDLIGGDSFENLSLSPSVDASVAGHWHGHITNGEAT